MTREQYLAYQRALELQIKTPSNDNNFTMFDNTRYYAGLIDGALFGIGFMMAVVTILMWVYGA